MPDLGDGFRKVGMLDLSERCCDDAIVQPTPGPSEAGTEPLLTRSQAYEAAYRFVWQYTEREPIVPFMLMLSSMEPVDPQGPMIQLRGMTGLSVLRTPSLKFHCLSSRKPDGTLSGTYAWPQ